jgi:hypothetical protein
MKKQITLKTLTWARNEASKTGREVYVWDTELTGFGLRASPTAISWLAQKRKGPRGVKLQRLAIGRYPPMELDEARELARQEITKLSQGVDLLSERRAKRQGQLTDIQSPTLRACVEEFIKSQEEPESDYWLDNRAQFQNHIYPALGEDTKI